MAKNSPRFSLRSRNLVKILAEILARSQNLAENLAEILARSQNLGGQKLAEISKSRGDSRRDLKILAAKNSPRISSRFSPRSWRDLRISAAKNSPRYQNLCGQKLADISKSRRPKSHRESRQDFKVVRSWRDLKVSAVKKLAENLGETRRVILKPKHLTEKTGRYFKMSTLRSR